MVASNFAPNMIDAAQRRTAEHTDRIRYEVVDATDETALLALGDAASFDAAICSMALFDMAEVAPLFRALATLLRPGGRFVCSVIHPSFNNNGVAIFHETDEGDLTVRRGVRVWEYMTPSTKPAIVWEGQARPHLLFHRPLQELVAPAFDAGFVLDGLEEQAFPPDDERRTRRPSCASVPEIPPVLVARLRLASGEP